jgi:type II secretory pathway pseudopilin PulG
MKETAPVLENEYGFSLTEFLVSALILIAISASILGSLSETQAGAGYQSEVQAVLDNTRVAMQLVQRHLRQAGNDPLKTGITGITIISATELRIQSDLTGSSGAGNPDKGDPDGDIADSNEDVTIRYNEAARTLELVPEGGPAQTVAGYISDLSFQYFDSNGHATNLGGEVRRISISISGSSLQPDPQTHERFGLQITSNIEIGT